MKSNKYLVLDIWHNNIPLGYQDLDFKSHPTTTLDVIFRISSKNHGFVNNETEMISITLTFCSEIIFEFILYAKNNIFPEIYSVQN